MTPSMAAAEKIPFLDLKKIHQSIEGNLMEAMDQVVEHGQFILGPEVALFEQEWANFCGVPAAIGAANGTAALHAILACLDMEPGDEVILPSHTFVATAESIILAGATPVFADVDPSTWLVDPAHVESLVTDRTRAIVPVHLYGMPADMNRLNALGCARDLLVVEDAAQGHGATLDGRAVGGLGIAAAFSFFPGKNLGAFGDAGAITTIDSQLAERVRLFINHGRRGKYQHDTFGTNYRLDTLQAAILSVKLRQLAEWTRRRHALAAAYRNILSQEPFLSAGVRFQQATPGAESCYHLFVVELPRRDDVQEALKQAGIGTGIHYPLPCHLQPSMARWSGGNGSLPVTEQLAGRILSLPMCPTLDATHAERVCDAIRRVLA